jgi:hypothetical protein
MRHNHNIIIAGLLLVSAWQGQASDWRPGSNLHTAVGKVLATGVIVERKTTLGWSKNLGFMGAFVQPGGRVTMELTLNQGVTYAFIGGGGEAASDVDIRILRGGVAMAKDTQVDANPMVVFQPNSTGRYTLELSMYQGRVAEFLAVAVLTSDGYRLPVENLDAALDKVVNMGTFLNGRTAGVRLHDHSNQWCMFGWVLRPGEEQGITNITLEPGKHYVIGAGDGNAQDVDLRVVANGQDVAADQDADATPFVTLNNSGTRDLWVKNVRSNGPAIVTVTVLTESSRVY